MMGIIRAHKKSQVIFMFNDEYGLSIIWGRYAYCGTYPDIPLNKLGDPDPDYGYGTTIESNDVEIMPYGDKFIKWMDKHYDGDDVFGFVPVDDLPKIISKCKSLADSSQPTPQGDK